MLCVTANWRELVDQPADGGQISPFSAESEGGKDCVAKSADFLEVEPRKISLG